MTNNKSRPAAEAAIYALADKFNVSYRETPTDELAHHITRLSGDDVDLDEPEQLLLALRRAGHISKSERFQMHAAYLKAKFG